MYCTISWHYSIRPRPARTRKINKLPRHDEITGDLERTRRSPSAKDDAQLYAVNCRIVTRPEFAKMPEINSFVPVNGNSRSPVAVQRSVENFFRLMGSKMQPQ